MQCLDYDEGILIQFINCYDDGIWKDDIPYISICESCESDTQYCGDICICRNNWRDSCFYRQYRYDSYTDYYPSDTDITIWKDKRILKLKEVTKRPYYMSGEAMLGLLEKSCLDEEACDMILNDIRENGYKISIKNFKSIMKKYLNQIV